MKEWGRWVMLLWGIGSMMPWGSEGQEAVELPPGVRVVWDLDKAWRESTSTRERICINGLWRWQPAVGDEATVPGEGWGFFKVPGPWPGITSYIQKDCQVVYAHPRWKDRRLSEVQAAWYQREISIPLAWAGRRVSLYVEYLNSYAAVYVDGKRVGEMRFPWGEVDLSGVCRPGQRHVLSLLVIAMPLRGVMLSYTDTASAREVKGFVARRGICGDVYLTSTPSGPRVEDVQIVPSVRRWEIGFRTALAGLREGETYRLQVLITDGGRPVAEFQSPLFTAQSLQEGRFTFRRPWKPEKLWDIHTPQNMYEAHLSLHRSDGALLDAFYPVRFGFREFWIQGRDFYLNGTRLFLSVVYLDNALLGAAWANYQAARETMRRLQSFGINFVYTHNYDCLPGSHLSFEEILRAADDVGMLVALSQPHFSHYDWKDPRAEETNGYAQHAAFYVRVAQNHPSVVAYSMSHNATGYFEDMNPEMIDGIHPSLEEREPWSQNNARLALRAEAIVERLDGSRLVYHHASGNLGAMHTSNFYANFVPPQEMSDWFEHWATQGVKPVFLCEYGVPFSWDWAMYRGWYQGKREFGSAQVPWEFCLAEWNAQFLGDAAFRISEAEKANLRWEAQQFRAGRLWHRWDYPYALGSNAFDERQPIYALYFTENWRAFRTWGVSAISPWELHMYWKLREGADKGRREFPVDWENLQRPGFSPDFVEQPYERMDLGFEVEDWIPTPSAQALLRNNRPLLAYIAGKPARFTSKDHNFLPGEVVEKQLIVINNSRRTVKAECSWALALPRPLGGKATVEVETGQQARLPLRFPLPADLKPGRYWLRAKVAFDDGEVQEDAFALHVLPSPPRRTVKARIALWDPKGETQALLKALGIPYRLVEAGADLSAFDLLVIGKGALTAQGPGPDLRRVREGLKVIVFEQTAEALERRLGFRVQEYGLRWVFRRVPGHPLLDGLEEEHLRDWRGEATLLPPRLQYQRHPRYGPTIRWCDLEVPRAWRCGNRGNVASVLIEKPACGDFLPVLDGGFGLQYSPLMEYREGQGLVLFCQMDVTGRTETDPAAEALVRNLFRYVEGWKRASPRKGVYVGEPNGRAYLEKIKVPLATGEETLSPLEHVLIVGPGGGKQMAPKAEAVAAFLKAGGHVLALGLEEQEANSFLPAKVAMRRQEHISTFFEPLGMDSLLEGIGPADVHNRDPREVPLVVSGAQRVGNGVLAKGERERLVFCQVVPWQFEYREGQYHIKRTFRRLAFLLVRLLGNMGVTLPTPLLERFATPVAQGEKRWLEGLYLDVPEEWDDPYRFFRW